VPAAESKRGEDGTVVPLDIPDLGPKSGKTVCLERRSRSEFSLAAVNELTPGMRKSNRNCAILASLSTEEEKNCSSHGSVGGRE